MKDIYKKANIRLTNLPSPELSEKVEEMLIHLLGVNSVKVDFPKKSVRIEYNLKFVTYRTLVDKLSLIGHPSPNGIFNVIKKNFIEFTEKNEIEGTGAPLARRENANGQSIGKS